MCACVCVNGCVYMCERERMCVCICGCARARACVCENKVRKHWGQCLPHQVIHYIFFSFFPSLPLSPIFFSPENREEIQIKITHVPLCLRNLPSACLQICGGKGHTAAHGWRLGEIGGFRDSFITPPPSTRAGDSSCAALFFPIDQL